MNRMWQRSVVPVVVGAAMFALTVLSLGIVFLCVWLVTAPAGLVPMWPLDIAAALIAVAWLCGLWWACLQLADYVRWGNEPAVPKSEAGEEGTIAGRVLEREYTVEIDGLRVRPRVMMMIMPHSHWRKLRERARPVDDPAAPDADRAA